MIWPKITADTPIEEVQRIHKDIWEYVIEHSVKPKTPYKNDCVLCEYAIKLAELDVPYRPLSFCQHCPADWGCTRCFVHPSPYADYIQRALWDVMHGKIDGAAMTASAHAVRDIPFKYKKEN